MIRYRCRRCGTQHEELPETMCCQCGASLWMDYPHHLCREDIETNEFSMWRYATALPVAFGTDTVTLGEGLSPLVRTQWNGRQILLKNESLLPTGSFKDRGIAMVVNCLKTQGVQCIAEDSSGNAGASMAAYAARADIKCHIYVPDSTSDGKIAQAMAFGAQVHKVPGGREQAAQAARNSVIEVMYAGHNWHPAFVEGIKTIAYELWEQNGFIAPDAVVCAVGNGSVAMGLYLGFSDLLESKQIDSMPRIYGVQAQGCDTTCRIFEGKTADYTPLPTVAEGIALYRPSKSWETAEMVRASGGAMVRVSEAKIVQALDKLAKGGFFAEPTSAAAFAGLDHLIASKAISPKETVAVTLSGNGLKASTKIFALLGL